MNKNVHSMVKASATWPITRIGNYEYGFRLNKKYQVKYFDVVHEKLTFNI